MLESFLLFVFRQKHFADVGMSFGLLIVIVCEREQNCAEVICPSKYENVCGFRSLKATKIIAQGETLGLNTPKTATLKASNKIIDYVNHGKSVRKNGARVACTQ
jgi:hypothetical protein